MGYTETTNLKLKKPTALTPETDWPGYITGNFDAIDTALAACLRKDGDALPDTDAVRSLGSAIRQFLNGYFTQLTLGGVTRSAWPTAGSGSESMDDAYNNGSVMTVDTTDVVHRLSTGRKVRIADPDETIAMDLMPGQIKFPAAQNASTDANTLDDYEKGTWTASFVCGTSGTVTIGAPHNTGWYVKVGRIVHVGGYFTISSVSSPLGSLFINGLPFVSASNAQYYTAVAVEWAGIVSGQAECLMSYFDTNATRLGVVGYSKPLGDGVEAAPLMKAGASIVVGGAYIVP